MGPTDPTTMDVHIEHLYEISRLIIQASQWRPALSEIAPLIRSLMIFDNLVVYLSDPQTHQLDVMYARAIGRGRSAEADIAWGESLANQIMDRPETTVLNPPTDAGVDRLQRPYLLGIPLKLGNRCLGVMVFIRFGSPPFSAESIQVAEYVAQQMTLLVEQQNLQSAYDLLEEQNQEARLQEDFISTITHELRTPLGFIKGYTTTLLRSDTSWDAETQQEFLRIIDQETDHLQELIETMLDSARLQTGQLKMEFQMVRMDTLIHSVVERATLHHPSMQISVDIAPQVPPIEGDPRRLAQVFDNLLNNAAKYAAGAPVAIGLAQIENGVEITIADRGPGIPQRYLSHIFERFFRAPNVEMSVHGSGLGLFICKKIVQRHSGNITAQSTLGEGTIFTITLPFIPEGSDQR